MCADCRIVNQNNGNNIDLLTSIGIPADKVPELPEKWCEESLHNLNGGHILKIFLLGNSVLTNRLQEMNDRVEKLESDFLVKDATVKKQGDHIKSNMDKVETLEKEIATLKKVI